MSTRELLSQTGRIFRGAPALFLLLAACSYGLATGGMFALEHMVNPSGMDPVSLWRSLPPLGRSGLFLAMWLMCLGVLAINEAGSLLAASEVWHGRVPALGGVSRRVLAALWRILVAQFVLTIASFLGGALLMIPGILILFLGALIVPAIVLGNLGFVTALRRGLKLAVDNFRQVVAVVGLWCALSVAWFVFCLLLSGFVESFKRHQILMSVLRAPIWFIATLAAIALAVVYQEASQSELSKVPLARPTAGIEPANETR